MAVLVRREVEQPMNEENRTPRRFRILPVDRAIAEQAAYFRAEHETPFEDSLLAATAKVHGLTLATRNTGDFAVTGISLINPWEHES